MSIKLQSENILHEIVKTQNDDDDDDDENKFKIHKNTKGWGR